MSVKGPGFLRVFVKPSWIGHLGKANASVAECRVGFPETFIASKGGESGVGPHTRTCTNEESFRIADGICGSLELRVHVTLLRHLASGSRGETPLLLFQKLDSIGDNITVSAFVGKGDRTSFTKGECT